MPNVPIEFLRGVLGVLCVFFAHMTGRSAALVRLGRQRPARLYMWLIRTFLCAAFLVIRHDVDTIALTVWILAAIACAIGHYLVTHQKPPEDLTGQIFPE